jgi:hypothetical protein
MHILFIGKDADTMNTFYFSLHDTKLNKESIKR